MAHDEEYQYVMQWSIENYSFCWQNKGEELVSPVFTALEMVNTKWRLSLYPNGEENGNYIGFFLNRENDEGPDVVVVDYYMQILAGEDFVLKEKHCSEQVFQKEIRSGISKFEKRLKILEFEKSTFLPLNTLTLRCIMIRSGMKTSASMLISAKTVINFLKIAFKWVLPGFSSLVPYKRIPLAISSSSEELILCTLYLGDRQFSDEIIFVGLTCVKNFKYCLFKVYLKAIGGNETECGRREFWFDRNEKHVMFPLHITQKILLENRDFYLTDDDLTLYCECLFSTCISFEGIVSTSFNLMSPQTECVSINLPKINVLGKQANNVVDMKKDFKALYKEGTLSDILLCSESKSFPVHAAVLSARSPMFKAMFSDTIKFERSIDITDLNQDTVDRMLQYIYTDTLEDLHWESAVQLYQAAYKYEICSLQNKCSDFLKDQLSPSNACEALLFADRHKDKDFKSMVQKYIIGNERHVFNLEEWKMLMKNNSKLAAETMHKFWEKEQN